MCKLPAARGPITEFLIGELQQDVHELPHIGLPRTADPVGDDDLQLALYLCYELHYRGLTGVDERWEWEPSLLALRGQLEERFEQSLRQAVPLSSCSQPAQDIDLALRAIAAEEGPSVSRFVQR